MARRGDKSARGELNCARRFHVRTAVVPAELVYGMTWEYEVREDMGHGQQAARWMDGWDWDVFKADVQSWRGNE